MSTPIKDPNGTWSFIVDVPRGTDGRRRQVRRRGFTTRREAQAAMDGLRMSARRGEFVGHSTQTVGAYLEGWLAALPVTGRRPLTVENYGYVVRSNVLPTLGGVRLQALTASHLDGLYASLLARGLSPRTVRLTHTVVRKALADAVRKGQLARNVADSADAPSPSASAAPEMAFWSPGELGAFLTATASDETYGPLYRLVGLTGLRRGEVLGLRWSDVDLEGGTLTVRQQLGMVGGALVYGAPKTAAGRRTIALDAGTVMALRERRRTVLAHRLAVGAGYDVGADLVFCGPAGEALLPDSVSQRFTRDVKRLGLPRLRFHDLRHSHCSHLIAASRNAKEVSRRLGHTSVSFTLDRYGHLMPEADSQAAAAVAALVGCDQSVTTGAAGPA